MLDELLKKQKEELYQELKNKERLNILKTDLEKELAELEERIGIFEEEQNEVLEKKNKLEYEQYKSPFKTFVKKIISKDYRLKLSRFIEDLDSKTTLVVNSKKQKLDKEKEHKTICEKIIELEKKEKELSLLEDEKYAIDKLISNDPSLLENEEFMMDLISRNIEYICFDKTNSEKVYSCLISRFIDANSQEIVRLERSKDDINKNIDVYDETEKRTQKLMLQNINRQLFISSDFRNTMYNILNELKNSKQPENDKYKIPHKFLFEAIRKSIIKDKVNGKAHSVLNYVSSTFKVFESYLKSDCVFSAYYGKEIEELYTNEEFDLYFHGTSNSFDEIIDSIFKNGVYLRGEYERDLSRTTLAQYQMECNFLTCLNYNFFGGRTIIMVIPKNEYAVLGNNTNRNDDAYILPQYVLGEIVQTSSGPDFVKNPIPLEQRTVYNYTYIAHKDEPKDESAYRR